MAETEAQREASSICWFTLLPQMLSVGWAMPNCSQETGTPSRCLIWVTGPQILMPSSTTLKYIKRKLDQKNGVGGT